MNDDIADYGNNKLEGCKSQVSEYRHAQKVDINLKTNLNGTRFGA